jgi:hypothetical protein
LRAVSHGFGRFSKLLSKAVYDPAGSDSFAGFKCV